MNVPRRILHVDDDPQITRLVALYLEEYGYQTTAIHDPAEVLQNLPCFQERVFLLDIDMPHINGLELLKEVKSFDGGIQVVMLTGLVTINTVLQTLRLGAEACFFKPIEDIRPLTEALGACFHKIDAWWTSLDDLSRRRKADSVILGAPSPLATPPLSR